MCQLARLASLSNEQDHLNDFLLNLCIKLAGLAQNSVLLVPHDTKNTRHVIHVQIHALTEASLARSRMVHLDHEHLSGCLVLPIREHHELARRSLGKSTAPYPSADTSSNMSSNSASFGFCSEELCRSSHGTTSPGSATMLTRL